MSMALGFNGLLIIILTYLYWAVGGFVETTIATDYWGPGGFPRLVIALSLVLLIFDSIVTYIKNQAAKRDDPTEAETFEKPGLKLLFIEVILLALYILLMNWLGYLVSTALMVFSFIKVMGYKSNLKAAVCTVILVAATIFVFGNMFGTTLPRGIGFLREFSFYLY